MPELPEVEVARRLLLEWIGSRAVVSASATPSRVLRGVPPRRIHAFVTGRRVQCIHRRGKHLLAVLDGDHGLGFHLGMSGRFETRSREDAEFPHERLALGLDDGRVVAYRDSRMFGHVEIGVARVMLGALEAQLGPDPLSPALDGGALAARLAVTRRPVKVALLDQSLLAGLGNIQASEALFRARIHPERPADSLSRSEATRLLGAMRASIADTLEDLESNEARYLQDGAENRFRVYGREGALCGGCKKAEVVRSVHGARATFHCPVCQVKPAETAERRR